MWREKEGKTGLHVMSAEWGGGVVGGWGGGVASVISAQLAAAASDAETVAAAH